MSTSYYVHCVTCDESVTDPNGCDNRPEIPVCIIENFIMYCHLGMFIRELPIPKNCWSEVTIKINGNHIDFSAFKKHISHKLIVKDEYGEEYTE